MTIEKLARVPAWLSVVLIVILSVLPGSERPHTGASGHVEHILAYSITAALLALAYGSRSSATVIVIGLSVLSGLMEIVQIFIPGEHRRA